MTKEQPKTPIAKLTIYHNPRCSKSREALDRLRKAGVEPKIVEYLKSPISPTDLDRLLKQMKLAPEQIVRKGEQRYIDLELEENPPKTRSAWVKLLADNPVLIERPIVTNGLRTVLGRPPENVDKILG